MQAFHIAKSMKLTVEMKISNENDAKDVTHALHHIFIQVVHKSGVLIYTYCLNFHFVEGPFVLLYIHQS